LPRAGFTWLASVQGHLRTVRANLAGPGQDGPYGRQRQCGPRQGRPDQFEVFDRTFPGVRTGIVAGADDEIIGARFEIAAQGQQAGLCVDRGCFRIGIALAPPLQRPGDGLAAICLDLDFIIVAGDQLDKGIVVVGILDFRRGARHRCWCWRWCGGGGRCRTGCRRGRPLRGRLGGCRGRAGLTRDCGSRLAADSQGEGLFIGR